MKKILILSFLFGFSVIGFTQNLKSEYQYLTIIKTQPKQLIKDNLRNAEMIADDLIFLGSYDKQTASLFFMELGDNYSLVKKPEFAIFSYLRQRFCFPNDTISLYVEKQILINAIRLNIEDEKIDFLIQNSAPNNLSENNETNLNNLIYRIIQIETKYLSPILLHQLELMNSTGMLLSDYVSKWEDLSRIGIPLKQKPEYLNHDFNTFNTKQKQFYHKYRLRYFKKQKARLKADKSLTDLNNLKAEGK